MRVNFKYLAEDLYDLVIDQSQLYITTDMDYYQEDSSSLIYFHKAKLYMLTSELNLNDDTIIYNNQYYGKLDLGQHINKIFYAIRRIESKKILDG